MAAAALATSRGVTVSSSIRGLFLMVTLLSLVCLSSALIDKNQLEELRENYQKTKQQMDKLKVMYEETVGFTSDLRSIMDAIVALMKKMEEKSADYDFLPQNSLMEGISNYLEKTMTDIDRKQKKLGGDIKENEKKLDGIKKLIEFFEEQQAEL